jgi:hypothetical protein
MGHARRWTVSFLAVFAAACGPAATSVALAPRAMPAVHETRQEAVDDFGRRLFAAMEVGAPQEVLYDDASLEALLSEAAARRYAGRRFAVSTRIGAQGHLPLRLRRAEYAGVCIQGARNEPTGTVLGLRRPGWVFDRALVIGLRPGGQRVASWVEGTFLYSDEGFHALDLERVEEPRWEHTELEIATCDLAVRRDRDGE